MTRRNLGHYERCMAIGLQKRSESPPSLSAIPSQLAVRCFCPFFRPSGHTWRGGVWRGGVWRGGVWRGGARTPVPPGNRRCPSPLGISPRGVSQTQNCGHPFVRIQRCDRVPVSGVEYITAVSHASASATESALTAPAFPAQPPFLLCLFPRKVTYDTSRDCDL